MKVLKYILCFFLGHKKETGYFTKDQLYWYKAKCERCDVKLGLPHLTNYNISKNYPIPK